MTSGVSIAEFDAALTDRFPHEWADSWDRVGISCGDAAARLRGVYVALDPSRTALDAAIAANCNVLLTHHPAFLGEFATLTVDALPAVAVDALRSGITLIAEHTNLDRAPEGATALPGVLGLEPQAPLERGLLDVAIVTAFVPPSSADAVVAAMHGAGAGRIGRYAGCSYLSSGTGSFTPLEGSAPVLGTPGLGHSADETRIEVVCPQSAAAGVIAAARAAHPFEEPLVFTHAASIDRGAARLGRVCVLPKPTALVTLAHAIAARLDVSPRVWGDPQLSIASVAVCSGSAGALVPDAIAAGVSALIAGEVRYHDALRAAETGCAIVEVGHDASELPLVPVLAKTAEEILSGTGVRVVAAEDHASWWTTNEERA